MDLFDPTTSETGHAASILFSEQVTEHQLAPPRQGPSTSRNNSTRSRTTLSPGTLNNNDFDTPAATEDAMGSMFFYVDDDDGPSTAGIIAGEVGVGTGGGDDSAMAEPELEPDDRAAPAQDVDMNFWLESGEDGPDDDGEDGDGDTTLRAEPNLKPVTTGGGDDDDEYTGAASQDPRSEDTTLFRPENESDTNDESEDDYHREPPSYHSGDSDGYEMEQRPWLERTSIKRDIRDLYRIRGMKNPSMRTVRYRVVDRLGEGTFSSVYLAYDTLHKYHDNAYWVEGEEPCNEGSDLVKESNVKVALKKILVTSSPSRVENELSILENLRGCRHVSPLVTAFRDYDQIVIVLPYHPSDDFRYFYRLMDMPKIKQYMTCLLRALKDTHSRGIIHRDVKPANFLFDYESGHGVLVDFGLAERYEPPRRAACQHDPATRVAPHGTRTKTGDTVTVEQAVYDARKRGKSGEGRIGFRQEDIRTAIKTNRAGTRGFRAPEVLLKCSDQTVAIDMWSAGIMLLSILAHKFPVFNSTDDVESLMEIAAVFGRASLERCAMLHNRTIVTNVPTVENPPASLSALILRLNPNLYTPHPAQPTRDEALAHITAVDGALDLCARLLRLDATSRLTAAVALRHHFLGDAADDGPDEHLPVTEGKCGHLHQINEDGVHQARFGDMIEDMRFGQGIPTSRDTLCPEHEHWQQRSGVNPLGAAYGATLDEGYYEHAGFQVKEEFDGWDDHSAGTFLEERR